MKETIELVVIGSELVVIKEIDKMEQIDFMLIIERSDDLTTRLEDYLRDSYQVEQDGSEVVEEGRKLKSVVLKWLDNSFSDMKLKE